MPDDKQYEALNDQLTAIRSSLHSLTHGNGRQGVHALLDDFYGPRGRERPGVMARIVLIEHEVQELKLQRRETRWLQRGVAIGVGLVALDTVFGFDLVGVLGVVFGIG